MNNADIEIINTAQNIAKLYAAYVDFAEPFNKEQANIPKECGDDVNRACADVFYHLAKKIVALKGE